MSRDPMGFALSLMTRLAGSPWLDRIGLRKVAEQTAFQTTKIGFQALSEGTRRFRQVASWLPRKHLPTRKPANLFDLALDHDQQLIVDSLHRLARESLRPAAVAADTAGVPPDELRQSALELGLTLYAVPEAFGGVADTQSTVTSVLIAEQLAWGDMGLALALLAPFSVAQAITRWGTGEQQSRYLPAFCDANPPRATIAIDEPYPLFDPNVLHSQARRTDQGYQLSGTKISVAIGQDSELTLVAADFEGQPRLFVIDEDFPGITRTPAPAMGLRAAGLTRLVFDRVNLPANALLGDDDFDYQDFLDRASLLRCGLALGTCQAVLDYVIPYCNGRMAFGEPISQRQSIAFIISNLAIETDSMRLLTWRAASRAEAGLPYHRETSLAQLLCGEKAMEIGSQGVQLLGGHGFVKEHPVERWYRDLRAIATQVGGTHA